MGAPEETAAKTEACAPDERASGPDATTVESSRDHDAGDGIGATDPLERGQMVGRYLILGLLGAGGMGVVYSAYDPELDRKIAIKLLLPRPGDRARSQSRLQQEAQAMAKLSHPNVVNVHDVGSIGDRVYIAMELVVGQTLDRWLAAQPRSWRAIVDVFAQVGRGLAAAHAEGLLHRDVKPANMMIDDRGRARIMDFGLARNTDDADEVEDDLVVSARRAAPRDAMTRVGALVGTPAYMAPEQFERRPIDARTDQFSFCVALWEALFGEHPFAAGDALQLMVAVTTGERRPPPKGRRVPGWLRRIVDRGLSCAREERFAAMDDLLRELASDPTHRRRRLVAIGAIALFGSAGIGAWYSGRSTACRGARDALAAVWDEARRGEIEAAMLGTQRAFAPEVWQRVGPRLDRWTDQWIAQHTDACEATRKRGDQSEYVMDLRMACLAHAKTELSATLDVLADATPSVIERAHALVDDLPRLERCADVAALQSDLPPPEPDDAETVAAIRAALADARASLASGAYEAGLTAVRRAEAQLPATRYEPVRAEVWVMLGQAYARLGRSDEAETILRELLREATRQDRWDLVRIAAIKLMIVVGHDLERHAEAMGLRELAEGLSIGDPENEAEFWRTLAVVQSGQGDYAQAEKHARIALDIREQRLGAKQAAVAASRTDIGTILHKQGRYAEAEQQFRAALETSAAALGPGHPEVAVAHGNIAATLILQGKHGEAEAEARLSLALREAALGAEHPSTTSARRNLAAILGTRGRYREAADATEVVIAEGIARLGPDHPEVGRSRINLANYLKSLGEYDRADAEYRTGLTVLQDALGRTHPDVATARHNHALLLATQARYAEAEAEYRAVIAMREEALGAGHSSVALSRHNLGGVLFERGELAQAEAEHRTALAAFESTLAPDHPHIADALLGLSRTLLAQGRVEEAVTSLEHVLAILGSSDAPPAKRRQAMFELGRALWPRRAERDRARALVRDAIDLCRGADDGPCADLATYQSWSHAHP